MAKRQYAAPTLRAHGAMTALTQQNDSGSRLDVTLNAGTPITEVVITLS